MSDDEVAEAELPLDRVGARLSRAREDAGQSRAQIAAITKIPERHLAAIEAGDFAALPARPYAIGFSRSYAKALGLDPDEIALAVRGELAEQEIEEPRRGIQTFEPGDPARIPGSRLVWLSVLGIIAVLVAVYVLARSMIAPAVTLPTILTEETAAPAATAAVASAPAPAGLVVFTALEPKVWVKFTDAAGNQLFQKELAQGESWTLPTDQADVRIATARPDALAITIGGNSVAKLSDTQKSIRDVPVTAAVLLARGTVAASPVPEAGPVAGPPQARSEVPVRQRQRRAPELRAAAPAPTAASGLQPAAAPPVLAPTPTPNAT